MTTVLPDVGDGLDQSSVDDRAGWFFPARLQGGTATQVLTITFESIARADRGAGHLDRSARPGGWPSSRRPSRCQRPPLAGRAVAAPAFTLPATGGAPMGLVGLGLALLVLGLGAGLVATRTTRRETS